MQGVIVLSDAACGYSRQHGDGIGSERVAGPLTSQLENKTGWGIGGGCKKIYLVGFKIRHYTKLPLQLFCLSASVKDSCQKPACYEKTVILNKEPHDSLGMTVAGGMSSRGWDLPIYVTNVDPDGVVGQEGSIRKGKMNDLPSKYVTNISIAAPRTCTAIALQRRICQALNSFAT